MEIIDLRTLISLVEQGSVTDAAKALHRVPSAITMRLQQLEHSLGVALFLREKKRFILTAEGQSLYTYALRIVDLIDEAESHVRNRVAGGRFRLGALDSMAATRLPAPLAELHANYPDLSLELTTGISLTLFQSLIENRLDATLIADAPFDSRLERMSVFTEALMIIAPASQENINTPDDIASDTVLAFSDGCSYRDRLLNWYNAYQQVPHRIVEMTSYQAILGAVAAGMGVGVVPTVLLAMFPQQHLIRSYPLPLPFGTVTTELLWRKGMLSANISALMTCLNKYTNCEITK